MPIVLIRRLFVAALILSVGSGLIFACGGQRRLSFSGKTMGTTYHITVMAPAFTRAADLQKKVEARLAEINQSMSTYITTSEISRFNASIDIDKPIAASADFMHVLRIGEKIFALTGGAWDATVWPLVRLWGFHLSPDQRRVPDRGEIDAALACVGFDKLRLLDDGIVKQSPCVTLDLASIAKGYGVDQIAALLKENGLTDFIVEIGGEIVAAGTKENGAEWSVGINLPEAYAPPDRVRRTLTLTDRAVATSGDYRNFFIVGNHHYSHILDPRGGYPVTSGVVSASVIADTCALADGLATALMVMPAEEGLALVNSLENTECLITVREENGQLKDYYSAHFKK